jgi:hypothetical protein
MTLTGLGVGLGASPAFSATLPEPSYQAAVMRLQQRLADRFRSSAAWTDDGAKKSRRDHRGRPVSSVAVIGGLGGK